MKKSILFFLMLLGFQILKAQEFEDFFDNYTGENKTHYLQPLNDVIIPNFNLGWFQSPRVKKGFHLDIGLIGSAGFVTENIRTFEATTESSPEFPFEPIQTVTVPTIVGDIKPVEVDGINGTSYLFPGGYDLVYAPFAIPQLTIGSYMGTEVAFRFFAYDINDEFGKLQVLGGGIRHSLSQYLKTEKFDWNVGYGFQSFTLGEKIDAKAHLIFMDIGQQPGQFYYFGRLGYQLGNMDIEYERDFDEGGGFFQTQLNDVFPILVSVGGGVDFWKMRLHAAVSYSKIPFGEAALMFCF